MINTIINIHNSILNDLAESLDISDTAAKEAEARYKAVGAWLGEGNSPLAKYSPQIYPQGSFLLGTVTKPINDADDYDIDLVFEVNLLKSQISQKQLKEMIGNRLKEKEVYKELLDNEGRRCWTLKYAESTKLHLDILPALPDIEFSAFLQKEGVVKNLAETGIAITDNTLPDYGEICLNWPQSNPKGYSVWFKDRMLLPIPKQMESMVFKAEVENVPKYPRKTPLQRSIQIIKRHRDIVFENDKDNKPASIILTTLAAHAYNHEDNISDAVFQIVQNMPKFITTQNGRSWVANPVNPSENFSDRWQDNPQREPSFRKWLEKLKYDMDSLLTSNHVDDIENLMPNLFGQKLSQSVMNTYKMGKLPAANNNEIGQVVKSSIVSIRHENPPWGAK